MMTDPYMHALVIDKIGDFAKKFKEIKMVDIGTGSGYLAFLSFLIFQEREIDFEIEGIDVHEMFIKKC